VFSEERSGSFEHERGKANLIDAAEELRRSFNSRCPYADYAQPIFHGHLEILRYPI
jgi:hypothetical protein